MGFVMNQCRWCHEMVIMSNETEDPAYKSKYQSFKHGNKEMHMDAEELDRRYDAGEHPLLDWIISIHDDMRNND